MFSNYFYDDNDFFGSQNYPRNRYNDEIYHGSYGRGRDHRMREQEYRREAHARRRRRELQEQQRYEQHLREQQRYENRLRQQYLQQQRLQQQAIAEREEKLRRLARQQLQQEEDENNDDEDSEIQLVQGRDGRLYYVKRPVYKQQRRPTIAEVTKPSRPRFSQNEGNTSSEETDDSSSDSDTDSGDEESNEEEIVIRRIGRPKTKTAVGGRTKLRHSPSATRKKTRRRITVTVEDASDSECENEFDSPWRNRRPSPGQWMEPVESYHE